MRKFIIKEDVVFFNTMIFKKDEIIELDKIYDVDKVVGEYDIHPTNFALARAVVGDASDNLPGAKGVGLKTMAKKFPQLKEEKSRLRKLVVVNDKFSTFTELQYNGRKLRVKYNRYGDCTVTENGKEIDTSLPVSGFIRPSINDLRLALAIGRI